MLVPFSFITLQCSWAPEIQTLIHTDAEGTIALETFSNFTIKPQHPHIFPEALIKQILQGITQIQERGVLQELLISTPKPSQVFTQADIDFLTPHLVEAISKATPEEIITFRGLRNTREQKPLSGKVAIFSPTIFFLTLQNSRNYMGNASKTSSSTEKLLKKTRLSFSQTQSILQGKDRNAFIKISPHETWIAIDYVSLAPPKETTHTREEKGPNSALPTDKPDAIQPNLNVLQEEIRDLRKKIEAQEKEIQRLQNTTTQ